MVMRVVKLSKLQIRSVFTIVLQKNRTPAGDQVLPREDVFYILLADMLENLAFLSGEQRMLICELVRAARVDLGLSVPSCGEQLAFADGRYATWTGATGWTTLESGDRVDQLPRTPLETIAYNLAELYQRGVQLIEGRAGFHEQNNAGSVDEQRDVCERPADTVSG